MNRRGQSKNVFINCPFDSSYKPLLDAIVFAVYDLGFQARCALEVDDASEFRLEKIRSIIAECPLGIHDISSVGLGTKTKLPRFNMPLELGLFLGCKFYGSKTDKRKACLILDSKPFRYRISISDIAGQDIEAHNGKVSTIIAKVRNWIASSSRQKALPGGAEISLRYKRFSRDLPNICKELRRKPGELTFGDYCEAVDIWLATSR